MTSAQTEARSSQRLALEGLASEAGTTKADFTNVSAGKSGFKPINAGRRHLRRTFDTVSARMILIILLSSLPLAALCGLVSWHNYEIASGLTGERAVSLANTLHSQTEQELGRAAAFARNISTLGDIDDPTVCERALRLIIATQEQHYSALSLLGPDGTVLCSAGTARIPPVLSPPTGKAADHIEQVVLQRRQDGNASLVAQLSWSRQRRQVGDRPSRHLVAELPLGWSRLVLFGDDGNAGLLSGDMPMEAWLVGPNGLVAPVCQDCGWTIPTDFAATRRRAEAASGSAVQIHGDAAVIGHLAGPVQVLTIVSPTPREERALSVFIIRVIGIVLLLGVGLVGVSIGANMLLVSPLQRLTAAVTHWRRVGGYDPHESRLMPAELRGLSHAFTQATRSLARHEATLREAETKQELLIKEIHHRVKNNLQIIASLLNLQANRIRQPEARAEFASARDRVRALATLHRYLYSEGELQTLNMRLFLQELCAQLFQAIGETQGRRIQLHIDAPEIAMATDQAVPLALVVTEAVSNAIKYAFPGGRRGHVRVSLCEVAPSSSVPPSDPNDDSRTDAMVQLVVQDDGVGIPAGRSETETGIRDGLGIQLIRGFSRQLGAVLDVQEGGGTRYTLTFPLHPKEADSEIMDTDEADEAAPE